MVKKNSHLKNYNLLNMSLVRLSRHWAPRLSRARPYSTTAPQEDEEYTATPQYPPIEDLSFEKRIERRLLARHEAIKQVKTVEEKQIKLNMPRYYGFKCYMLSEEEIPYNSLAFTQHVTRTHLIHNNELPEYYTNINVDNAESLSNDIQEALLLEIDGYRRIHDLKKTDLTHRQQEDIISSSVIRSLNRILSINLAPTNPHILNNEVDLDPRLEASWVVGGMKPDETIKKIRRARDILKKFENDPVDRTFYYLGTPSLTIRSNLPLPHILSPSDAENDSMEVPHFQYDPRVLGNVPINFRHVASIPGFWPGDSHTFGLMSFLRSGHLDDRDKLVTEEGDMEEARHRQAILHSYAWLHSQANYLGFTTFNDITYPLVTQTVLTDGRRFRFYVYQLNTIVLHSNHTMPGNPKRNICWASAPHALYERVEQGKLVGFNSDVVGALAKMYANAPAERLGVNLRPYLSHEEKLAADYEDGDKRKWLEKEYKFLASNWPRLKEMEEVYNWEKIYKVDHKTRFTDRRTKAFELMKRPWRRTLDDRLPEYVPKALRPDLPKNKGRRVKEYFP